MLLYLSAEKGVYMASASQAFEILRRNVRELRLNIFQKNTLEEELRFFIQQSLCDVDRRLTTEVLRGRWDKFIHLPGANDLVFKFRNHYFSEWIAITNFCSISEKEPAKKTDSFPGVSEPSPETFFAELAEKVDKLTVITAGELNTLRYILKYLIMESDRPCANRDIQEIQRAWRVARPILERTGVLNDYQKNESLRSAIKLFIFQKIF
jgi:hypothetical protein